MNEKSHGRTPGITQTTIALPATLLERVAELAKRERRSRNNMLCLLLEEALAAYYSTRIAADPPGSSYTVRRIPGGNNKERLTQ